MENLIPLVNKLQETFATVGISGLDLPQIAVVGSQSSGKSSVLESLVQRDFLPRGSGIVTRRPLVLQLIRDQTATQDYAVFLHDSKKMTNFQHVRDEITRETDRLTGTNRNISSVPIYLKIYSKRVIDLTLVDLPGLTKVAVGDQPEDIEHQIRDMVHQFVEKESCLILAVTPANVDLANSDALQLARKVDPEGNRTIGVLTKLDLIDEGVDALDILQNKVYPLKHGFVGVVNRSQKDIDNNKDVHSAQQKESQWFGNHPVYAPIKSMCGTSYLQEKLRQTLMHHIAATLPQLKQRLVVKEQALQSELDALNSPFDLLNASIGSPTSERHNFSLDDGPVQRQTYLLSILRLFASTVKMMIDGHDGDIGNDAFNALGHITGTSAFTPGDKYADGRPLSIGPKVAELNSSVRIKYIFQDIYPNALQALEGRLLSSYYDEEIRTLIHNVRGLRSGLFIPDAVFELLIKKLITQLEAPALSCVDMVHVELIKMIKGVLEGPQSPVRMFPALLTWMLDVTQDVLAASLKPTQEEVQRLIKMEVGYINTSHPDFLGKKGLGNWMTSEKKRQAKMRKNGSSMGALSGTKHLTLGHKDGMLMKLGGQRKNWKKRWFLLKDGMLYFYENAGDKQPKGEFSLENCLVRDLDTKEVFPLDEYGQEVAVAKSQSDVDEAFKGKSFVFELFNKDAEVLFRNHQSLHLQASTDQEKDSWISILSESIEFLRKRSEGLQTEPSSPVSENVPPPVGKKPPPITKRKPPVPPSLTSKRPPTPAKVAPGVLAAIPDKLMSTDLQGHKLVQSSSLAPELAGSDDEDSQDYTVRSDDTTITLVRVLVHSYFQIIRKHIQDLVPKAVMYLMVGKVKRDLPTVLMNRVLGGVDAAGHPLDVEKLLVESDGVKGERLEKVKMLKMLKEALKVINTEVQVSMVKQQ